MLEAPDERRNLARVEWDCVRWADRTLRPVCVLVQPIASSAVHARGRGARQWMARCREEAVQSSRGR